MSVLLFWQILALFINPLLAKDLGFRYLQGQCLNQKGEKGLNPGYFGQCGDLRLITINRVNFDGVDFSGANFSRSTVEQDSFVGAILNGVDFSDASLAGSNLSSAQVNQSQFNRTNLKQTHFNETVLAESQFIAADFSGNVLSYLRFENSNLAQANLSGATLDSAEFINTTGDQANLKLANLASATFQGGSWNKALFSGADLQHANLSGMKAIEAIFKGANLGQASLLNSEFKQANFQGANLKQSDLRGADLSAANLLGANFQETQLQSAKVVAAKFNRSTSLPFSKEMAEQLEMVFTSINNGMVSLFYDQAYVDASEDTDESEAFNLKNIFTQFLGADSLLTFKRPDLLIPDHSLFFNKFIVIPDQENGNLGAALSPAEVAQLKDYLDHGGIIIEFGDSAGYYLSLLKKLTDWRDINNYNEEGQSAGYIEAALAQSTISGLPRKNITGPNGNYCITGLPEAHVLSLYKSASCTYIFEAEVGEGRIFFFSYDWFRPKDSVDWNEILKLVISAP